MFYAHEILHKRGKFGMVWMAATNMVKLNRRDVSAINLRKQCEEIIDYIVHKRGRKFSLYLSSQLMYGAVKLYHKQQHYLMSDVIELQIKFHTAAFALHDIDLPAHEAAHEFQNRNILDIEGIELATGDVFLEPPALPSDVIPEYEVFKLQTPQAKRKSSSERTASQDRAELEMFRPEFGSPHQARVTDITLVEQDQPLIHELQFPLQDELPQFPDGVFCAGDVVPSTSDITAQLVTTTEEELANNITGLGLMPPSEVTPAVLPDADLLLQEPRKEKEPAPPELTPISPRKAPERRAKKGERLNFELVEIDQIELRPRGGRKRRHLIVDTTTQIPRHKPNSAGLVMPPSLVRIQTQDQIDPLVEPGCSHLRGPTLKPHFTKGLKTKPQKYKEEGQPWTVSIDLSSTVDTSADTLRNLTNEFDGSVLARPLASDLTGSELGRPLPEPGLSPVREHPVDTSSAAIETARRGDLSSTLAMETSRASMAEQTPHPSYLSETLRSEERSSFVRESIQQSPQERRDLSKTVEELNIIQEVPEEQIIDPQQPLLEPQIQIEDLQIPPIEPLLHVDDLLGVDPADNHAKLLRLVSTNTRDDEWTTFDMLCPVTTARDTVVSLFTALLDLCKLSSVKVVQEAPYDIIHVARGRNW